MESDNETRHRNTGRKSRACSDASMAYSPSYEGLVDLAGIVQTISINENFAISIETVNYEYYDYETSLLLRELPESTAAEVQEETTPPMRLISLATPVAEQPKQSEPEPQRSVSGFPPPPMQATLVMPSETKSPEKEGEGKDDIPPEDDEEFKTVYYETRLLDFKGIAGDDQDKEELRYFGNATKAEFESDLNLSLSDDDEAEVKNDEVDNSQADYSKSTYERFTNYTFQDIVQADPTLKPCPEIKINHSHPTEVDLDDQLANNEQVKKSLKSPFLDLDIVNELESKPNPIYDRSVLDFVQAAEIGSNPVLKCYGPKMNALSFNKEVQNPYCPESKTPEFIHLFSKYKTPPTPESSKFMPDDSCMRHNFCFEKDIIEVLPEESAIPKAPFAFVNLIDFQINAEVIEPIICSAFLFNGGKICTSRWQFTHPKCRDMMKDTGVYQNDYPSAGFEIGEGEMYLVIEIRRPLLVSAGLEVNDYYMKPEDQKLKLKAIECVKNSYPRTKAIYTTFAVICTPLARILDSSAALELPKPLIVNQPATPELIERIIQKDVTTHELQKLDWTIKLQGFKFNATNITEVQDRGYYAVLQTMPSVSYPTTFYINKFFFGLRKVSIKAQRHVKARNIFAKISLYAGPENTPLKSIYSPFTGKREAVVYTQCWYHNERAQFNEVFMAEIPYPLPQNLHFHVELFHGVAQESMLDSQYIGSADVPCYDERGHFNPQLATVPISIKDQKADAADEKKSTITFSTRIRSTFYSEDPNIQDFFLTAYQTKILVPSCIEKARAIYIRIHLLSLLQIVIAAISKQPYRACKVMYIINKVCGPAMGVELNKVLHTWALNYAFQSASEKTQAHLPIFSAWSELIEEMKEANEDQHLVNFFFILMFKSLAVSNNKTYMGAAEAWVNAYFKHLFLYVTDQNQIRLRTDKVGWFVNALFDIGKYTLIGKILNLAIKHNFDKSNEIVVLQRLVRRVISPRIFYVLSVHYTPFKDLYLYMFNRMYVSMNNETFSDFAFTLYHINMCLDPGMRKELAASYDTMKGFKTPLQGFFYSDIDATQISDADFQSYWNGIDHRSFFKIFHLYATIYNYKINFIPEELAARAQVEVIHAMQRGFIAQLLPLNRVTADEDIMEVMQCYFQVVSAHLAIDNIALTLGALCDFIKRHPQQTIKLSNPIFSVILKYVFNLSKADTESATKVIDTIFDPNFGTEVFGMALASLAMAVCTTKTPVLDLTVLKPKSPLARDVPKIIQMREKPLDENISAFIAKNVISVFYESQRKEISDSFNSFFEYLKTKANDPLPKFK